MPAHELMSKSPALPIGWALTSLVLAVDAALAAIPAWDHMRAIGRICGDVSAAHCGWCVAVAGFAALSLVAMAQAARLTIRAAT
ncbi:hypothetical protein [Phenylobacterium sp.]|jgi:hypothetical protein|uniref:hypothetical protein n=1 Tax=Phenylobacterium sp. TaxID=1871053 RepID=UPI0037C94920